MSNPLLKFYRIPGICTTVPSKGKHQPDGNTKMSLSQEVEVYPMRTADEMLLKSPDALISGNALEMMLQSCIPGVADVRALPYNDVDALLVAIRSVSYGEQLTIGDACPECNEEQTFDINLPFLLETMTFLKDEYVVELGEMKVHMRPLTLGEHAVMTRRMYNEARRMKEETSVEGLTDDERVEINSKALARMQAMNLDMVSLSIKKVLTPDGEVSDQDYIREFVADAPRSWVSKMEHCVKEITNAGIPKSKTVVCGNCEHEWETSLIFDPTSFFNISS